MGSKKAVSGTATPDTDAGPQAPPLTRRERFLKYAAKRTNRALVALRNVERMGNQASYEYTPEEVKRIADAIQMATDHAVEAFFKQQIAKQEFTL